MYYTKTTILQLICLDEYYSKYWYIEAKYHYILIKYTIYNYSNKLSGWQVQRKANDNIDHVIVDVENGDIIYICDNTLKFK